MMICPLDVMSLGGISKTYPGRGWLAGVSLKHDF